MTKSIFQSKTVWFNLISLALAIIALPEFISLLPQGSLPFIALINSIGNLILRVYFTSEPIENKPADEM
jgi:hypothetical protein